MIQCLYQPQSWRDTTNSNSFPSVFTVRFLPCVFTVRFLPCVFTVHFLPCVLTCVFLILLPSSSLIVFKFLMIFKISKLKKNTKTYFLTALQKRPCKWTFTLASHSNLYLQIIKASKILCRHVVGEAIFKKKNFIFFVTHEWAHCITLC